jgi:hypothetical protein
MRIEDSVSNKLVLGTDEYSDTVGIVIKTDEEMEAPQLGVIIPKFMLGYTFKNGDKASEQSISIKGKKCINEDSNSYWDSSIMLKNYITVDPLLNQNQSMAKYTIGDKVLISMIDNDIKTLSFLPYSINRLGQRATDKFIVAVPANEHENTALSEDNTYFIKMDSSKDVQVLQIATSNKNNETCMFRLTMDSKNGVMTIDDDSGDRSWEMDYQNDSIVSKTSGSTITQSADKIRLVADTIEAEADTKIYMKTDTLEVEANTIKEKSSDTKYEFDNFKQTSDVGTYEITNEKHNGTSTSFKEKTFHCDTPTIGLNGIVTLPSYTIGNIPDINIPVPSVNGTSGPKGSTVFQSDPSGVPLVKFPQLMTCLAQIAAAADMYPSGAGMGSSAVASFAAGGSTTKIMCS